ncbi:hypothetical protein THAOC_33098, partial [Thalassiosira oceanica]
MVIPPLLAACWRALATHQLADPASIVALPPIPSAQIARSSSTIYSPSVRRSVYCFDAYSYRKDRISLGSVDEGHAARNFPDRRRGPVPLSAASSTLLRRISGSGHDVHDGERALVAALKANTFPATSDHAGLQIAGGRGIRPRLSAISGAESGLLRNCGTRRRVDGSTGRRRQTAGRHDTSASDIEHDTRRIAMASTTMNVPVALRIPSFLLLLIGLAPTVSFAPPRRAASAPSLRLIKTTVLDGTDSTIQASAKFIVDNFWLSSPQQLLLDDQSAADIPDSSYMSLRDVQFADLQEKYGERLTQRKLDALMIAALDEGDDLAGMVTLEVVVMDTQTK